VPSDACQTYTAVRTTQKPRGLAVRQHCVDLWRDFAPFVDSQFVAEFPRHFHERWFEMYLTVSLLHAGADVQPTQPPGPDVLVRADGRRIWIEAICGTGGAPGLPDSIPAPVYPTGGGARKLRERPVGPYSASDPERLGDQEGCLRSVSANQIVAPDDVLLVAINVREIPYAWPDESRYMFRALFGVGNQVLMIDRATAKAVSSSHEQLVSIPKKSTGAPVGTMPFIDDSMPNIAGVVCSSGNAANAPSPLGADLTLFPNLTASAPWIGRSLPGVMEWAFEQNADGWSGSLQSTGGAPLS
jgi:hypothetical protein